MSIESSQRGGKTTLARYGRKHFVRLAKAKRRPRYRPPGAKKAKA